MLRTIFSALIVASFVMVGMSNEAHADTKAATPTAATPKLPAAITTDFPDKSAFTVRGDGALRFIGMKVYDIRLWTNSKAHSHTEPYALELVYDLALKGAKIAERSVAEMRKVGYTDEAKLKRWGDEMAKIFPDVKKGDTLVGVFVPGKEVRFYSQTKLIAAIPDVEFGKAFFDIWLSEKTSEPKLRQRLMGTK
jgi:hypothetical protein